MFDSILVRVFSRARGQGMIEYGLIVALIVVVVVSVLILIGGQLGSIFSSIQSAL
ncbi:MAG: Flp family type IVb pilin [Ktedonobacterales bacterium]